MAWRAAAVIAAIAAAAVPLPAWAVEQYYSRGIYGPLQRAVTTLSNAAPFALLDFLILGTAGWWLARLVSDLRARGERRRTRRALARAALRTVTAAAVIYLFFLAVWGWNYRRVPFADQFAFDAAAVSPAAARQLAVDAAGALNALHASAHRSGFGDLDVDGDFAAAFARAQQALGIEPPARPARPKRTLLDPYFVSAGVAGMTDPFFLETLVASDLLPVERPFVVAHEWSHLAGFADEGEANLIGWLACIRGSESARYSGWLFLFGEVAGALAPRERAGVLAMLGPGPRADLRAIAERIRRNVKPAVSAAGWRVYDSYLRANRIEAGTRSYAEVVRLMLGTRFDAEWTPRRSGSGP
jgi:Protein of unknown function (DUF3810)